MSSYNETTSKHITLQLRELLRSFPPYVFDFFRGMEHTCSAHTRLAYAYDLRIFLDYMLKEIYFEEPVPKSLKEITLAHLDALTPVDIEKYLEYLSYYEKDSASKSQTYQNNQRGKARKLSSLKSFFNYYYRQGKLQTNPTHLVDLPKISEKSIIKLEIDEIVRLLDEVESGTQLTKTQKRYHKYTKSRDLAIISLLLGTGIRVSECVGLDIDHVNFDVNGIKITRKGGNEVIIYFGVEVEYALKEYLKTREAMQCKDEGNPLFLSLQHKRLSVRSIQLLVKKYSGLITSLKTITPHKLRSTYGTQLYQETGDIYLVADVLGHTDVNTTKKHYAKMDDARRKMAASIVKLREIDD